MFKNAIKKYEQKKQNLFVFLILFKKFKFLILLGGTFTIR